MRYLFFALRPKQWIKNFFVFVPLIFAEKLFVFPAVIRSIMAFMVFSLAAGTAYLVNDLLDFNDDIKHPLKRLRPIASGKITKSKARTAALLLGVLAIIFSFVLDIHFGWVVLSYLVLNLVYTRFLKEIVIVDVFCLGVFFLLRIIAGSTVVKVEASYWVMLLAAFLALFLGLGKRRQELILYGKGPISSRQVLKRYNTSLIDKTTAVIVFLILLSYTLYTIDSRTVGNFGTNHLIYSVPFVFFGVFRYLYLIRKLNQDGDPTRVLLSDTPTKINLLLWIIVCVLVIYFGF